MAIIRTKSDLIDKVSEDHVWRVREIAELKNLIRSPSTSGLKKRVICRAGIALMYAHWEGFVKKSGTYFLEYVAGQRHSISDLKMNFVVLLVKSKLDAASKSEKYSTFYDVTQYVINNQSTRARIPVKDVVNTESNLSTSVLKEIMWCLGLDYSVFETKHNLINVKLVNRRNHIAHGKPMEVDIEEFCDMADEVLALMDTFKSQLENSCVGETYKATHR